MTRSNRARTWASHRDNRPARRWLGRVEEVEPRTLLATFLVTNTSDSGPGSLRQAILDANADTTGTPVDTIDFAIPGGGVQTIRPCSELPAITRPVLVDGYSQPGSHPNTLPVGSDAVLLVELDGSRAGDATGLKVHGGGSTVRGLVINRFAFHGITLSIYGGNRVSGNYIGTDATGTVSLGNGTDAAGTPIPGRKAYGVWIFSGAGNVIGTDGVGDLGERNVISANGGAAGGTGVLLGGDFNPATDTAPGFNVVAGNYIGTDSSGSRSLGNQTHGVEVYTSHDDLIGTNGDGVADDAERNVISGNFGAGVFVTEFSPGGNALAGNYIGTDATGTKAVPNANGVAVQVATRIGVNGTDPNPAAEGNVISGNAHGGINLDGSDCAVAGNYIGVDATGGAALGNGDGAGIFTYGGARNRIGTNGDGKHDAAERNVISGNASGIAFWGAVDCVIAGNYIGTDATGMLALGNKGNGIWFFGQVSGNRIGTNADGVADAAERNLISGNAGSGVSLDGTGSHDNVVAGNYIGTNILGTGRPGGQDGGVSILHGAAHNRIGTNGDGINDVAERNLISGNETGVFIDGAGSDQNRVAGNYIGTDVNGSSHSLSTSIGINISGGAKGNLIGTDGLSAAPAAEGNVISNGRNGGIAISGAGTDGNVVAGNLVGTDATGTVALGNLYGITVTDQARGTRIGTNGDGRADAAERNVVAPSMVYGIYLFQGADGTVVAGNLIGTDGTGAAALGTGNVGLFLHQSASCRIGTDGNGVADDAERNLIAGGSDYGLLLAGDGNLVAGNAIGTNFAGIAALGNGKGVLVVGSSNTIGGVTAGMANQIAHNTGYGVGVRDDTSVGNRIRGNSIHDNGGLGLDLGLDGVTFNGTHAPGSQGPNRWQTSPVISAAYGGASTYVAGSLHTTPSTVLVIDFYSNTTPDPSGYGQGRTYLGSVNVTTDASGDASFQVPGITATPVGQWVVATATASDGSTSEFSTDAPVTLVPTTTTVVASAATPLVGDSVTFTATVGAAVSGFGSPSGSVQFAVDGNPVGSPVPLGSGQAGFTTSTLAVGGHTVTATYSADSTFGASLGSATPNVIPPASLSGVVFADFNDDGQVDFGEKGIAGVAITLTGTDDLGHAVNLSQNTDSAGTYVFQHLRPGSYKITEPQEPAGFTQGINAVGTAGGSVSGDEFTVGPPVGVNGLNYNFGERPATTGSVREGQAAGIGFWNNKNGQALVKALNGGAGTQLGDWLAATFPHMFGASSASNNLAGKNNAYVASFFQGKFLVHEQKLDAQVLATALSVYVSNATLDNTGVGTQYGFTVSGYGLGTATVNVGVSGSAFGVADNTRMSVMDLLLATDAQAVNGVLYNGDAAKRARANKVFSDINES